MNSILKTKFVSLLLILINIDSIYSAGYCQSEGGCCSSCRKLKIIIDSKSNSGFKKR